MTRNMERLIRQSRISLGNPYAYLNDEGGFDAAVVQYVAAAPLVDKSELVRNAREGYRYSRKQIERIARKLQGSMWRHRKEIFGTDDVDPISILDPVLALHALGYKVELRESLGQHSAGKESYEVAGIMDSSTSSVQISRRYAPALRNFTAAHELGHALLHRRVGLHRDRAPDGTSIGKREPQELEADIFASFFLLPEKQVRAAFEARFLTDHFVLTDASAFALAASSVRDLRRTLRSKRDLSRRLASTHSYNGAHFSSLAERFGVSPVAMAIRIEELGLVGLE